jgi:hypothetical protein
MRLSVRFWRNKKETECDENGCDDEWGTAHQEYVRWLPLDLRVPPRGASVLCTRRRKLRVPP